MCHWHSFPKDQMKPVPHMGSLHSRRILAFWNKSETLFLTWSVQPDVKFLYSVNFASLALYKLCEVSQITLHLCCHTLVEALRRISSHQGKETAITDHIHA